jgi:hypothetical protein
MFRLLLDGAESSSIEMRVNYSKEAWMALGKTWAGDFLLGNAVQRTRVL